MTARLFALSYSPWSEKARWALDHHRVEYEEIAHVPMLGEPLLRLRARRARVSVPLFVDGDVVLGDSAAIARHADAIGRGAPLFPAGREAEVGRIVDATERGMRAGRVLVLARTLRSDEAKREALPSFVPAALRGAMTPVAAMGASFVARKYAAALADEAGAEATLAAALAEVRRALGGRAHLLEDLSFADVAAAALVQFVSPVADRFVALGPATRACWTSERLASDFADLVAWRDRLYEAHRDANRSPPS